MFVENITAMVKQLAALKTGFLDTGEMGLFQNAVQITPNTVLTDLTEATFNGYARATLTAWSAAFPDPQAPRGVIQSPTATFTKTAGATTNIIHGYFITDTDGAYVGAETFVDANGDPAPISVLNTGQVVTVTMQKQLGNVAG